MVEVENVDMNGEVEEEEEKNDDKEFQNLTPEMMEKVKDTFATFEKEQSGSMEFEALGTLLRWLNFNPTEEELLKYQDKYEQRNDKIIKYNDVLKIVDQKVVEPDTIEEFIEAAKIFDHDGDGKIEVSELRWAMSKLGDKLKDQVVDEMINEFDKDKTGFIEIEQMAKVSFGIKDEKSKDDKKNDKKNKK